MKTQTLWKLQSYRKGLWPAVLRRAIEHLPIRSPSCIAHAHAVCATRMNCARAFMQYLGAYPAMLPTHGFKGRRSYVCWRAPTSGHIP